MLIKLQPEDKVLFQSSFPSPVELVITQSLEHVNSRLTSQLINGISRVLQKLLKYFNGTIISTSFVFPSAGVFPVFFYCRFKWFRSVYVIIWIIFIVFPQTSRCFWIIVTIFTQVVHQHYNINIFGNISFCVVCCLCI